ncbi:MAG: hypothetical protein RBT37_08895 [Dissulfurispiraceae bacterium]|jgi:hypothetical protein|nr:hypothetical protein [Dissulfurispiraceae bacterium]
MDNRDDLEQKLRMLKNDYEDLKETMSFDFNYSCAHISSKKVKKDEECLQRIKDEIERIEMLLCGDVET